MTNRKHHRVSLSDIHRHVLCRLDGTQTADDIEQYLLTLVQSGSLLLHHQGEAIRDPNAVRALLAQQVPEAIEVLSRLALLVS